MTAIIHDPETGASVQVEVSGRTVPTPAEAREAARLAFVPRISRMTDIIDGCAEDRDKVAAFTALSRIGMMSTVSMDDVRARLVAQAQVIQEHLGPGAGALLEKLSKVWR